MSRRWLVLALLLSVGVNVGILATLAAERLRDGAAPEAAEGPEEPSEPPADVPEQPGAEEPGAEPEEPRAGPGPGPRGGPGPPPLPELERRLEGLADRLGLAGEERGRFLDIQRRFFRDGFRRRQEVLRHQRALRQELIAPTPDRARVGEALDRLSAARDDLDRALIDAVLESRELLDPAQEAEYLRFVARLRAAGEGGRPGGPPGNRFRRRP